MITPIAFSKRTYVKFIWFLFFDIFTYDHGTSSNISSDILKTFSAHTKCILNYQKNNGEYDHNDNHVLITHIQTGPVIKVLISNQYYRLSIHHGTIWQDIAHNTIISKVKLRPDFELMKDTHISRPCGPSYSCLSWVIGGWGGGGGGGGEPRDIGRARISRTWQAIPRSCHEVVNLWKACAWWTISWWRHQLETFSALLALCAWNSPATVEFRSQRLVTRSFNIFFEQIVWQTIVTPVIWDVIALTLWRRCNAAAWVQHIEAETKWPPFRRRLFQTHFPEWKW